MNGRAIQLILVAALVAVAGCAGGMGGAPGSNSPTDDSTVTDSDQGAGTAAFYVSDQPNVIDDFRHLNVTITKVGFKKAGDASSGDSNETDGSDGNESTDGTESANETSTEERDGNETTEEEQKDEEEKGDDGKGDDSWVEYDVDNRTVDLTQLKGANASMIGQFELPAGDYEKVFIYVSDTEGILTDGSQTRVKLPSSKLHLNTKFTIGNNESVDFVYDIAPHKAGKSGKYILRPVISQSGTGDDVEIRDIDAEKGDDGKQKNGKKAGNEAGGQAKEEQKADDE